MRTIVLTLFVILILGAAPTQDVWHGRPDPIPENCGGVENPAESIVIADVATGKIGLVSCQGAELCSMPYEAFMRLAPKICGLAEAGR